MELEDFSGDLAGGFGRYAKARLSEVADRGGGWATLFYTGVKVDGRQDKLDMRCNVCGQVILIAPYWMNRQD